MKMDLALNNLQRLICHKSNQASYSRVSGVIMKCLKKKLDRNYTKMLRAVLNKSKKQYITKRNLNGHLLPISQTTQVR